jgi:hypothetical protein
MARSKGELWRRACRDGGGAQAAPQSPWRGCGVGALGGTTGTAART